MSWGECEWTARDLREQGELFDVVRLNRARDELTRLARVVLTRDEARTGVIRSPLAVRMLEQERTA